MKHLEFICNQFKALANDNRLRIYLNLLGCCKPGTECRADAFEQFCIGDIGAKLDIAPSTLSHHIKELHRAGLISVEKKGQFAYCSVNVESLEILRHFFD
jgi:ArsR family transcriptional regulator, arsenate/arsenite/antimonite-responsive transcriptional repressor